MRKLILATASILALGIGGAGATLAADMSGATPGSTSNTTMPGNSTTAQDAVAPSRSQIEQAQQQLHAEGLYNGQIDGVTGSETQQAVRQYQQKHGLRQTATLDQDTLRSLTGSSTNSGAGYGQGSSTPPASSSYPSGSSTPHSSASPGAGGMNR